MNIDPLHKEHEQILKGLNSADPEKVLQSIEHLRVSGKASDIPLLLEMLRIIKDKEIKSKVAALLGTLKDKATVPLMIEAIKSERYASIRQQLVSACWENGLDYTAYLPVFIDLLIKEDFLVAFEAYTVIVNMETAIDRTLLDVEVEKLDKAMRSTTDDKRALMLDVVDFLPSIGY